ncbi:MAG: hypothetical protein K0S61_178 [Anaerocolumna sp.]|nr:hypothetical protein [Anaerocolumna sp.]
MLHMVLFLLKIIGILIGVILGLLLILILVVLLVPIRYRIWADNREDLQGRVKVTWLLRIISLQIAYVNEKLSIKLKIFGRIFFDNNNPRKASKGKGPKLKKSSSKKNNNSKKNNSKKNNKKKNNSKKNNSNTNSQNNNNSNLTSRLKKPTLINNEELDSNKNEYITKNNAPNGEHTEDISYDGINLENKIIDNKGFSYSESGIDINEQKIRLEVPYNESNLSEHRSLKLEDKIDLSEDLNETVENEKGFFQKVKNTFMKIKNLFLKIKLGFEKVKNLFHNLGESISNIAEKWDKIKNFYKSNKQGIKQSFYAIKKISKHVLPRKIKGQVEFGTGDPCSTGQVLGVAASFYGIYGKYVQIIPNFNEAIIEGDLYIYGRIRIVTLLIIGVKLILNKNFKELIKNFRALKEDL